MNRSIVQLACAVEESGLCTPDWVLSHYQDDEIRGRLYTKPLATVCKEIEHQRHFLFDELPKARTISGGLWRDPKDALSDYLGRVGQADKVSEVQALWN